jgi:TonB family protein
MKKPLRTVLTLFCLQIVLVIPSRGSEIVRINPKFKADTISAPDPDYPMKAQHLGYEGNGIYRLVVNQKTGVADEVKVVKSTGHRELDASAVMTLFNWKFRPGAVKERDVFIVFHLTGWSRDLH